MTNLVTNLVTSLEASLPKTSLETTPRSVTIVGNHLTKMVTSARQRVLHVPNVGRKTILHRFASAILRLAKTTAKAATLSSANVSRSAEKSLPRSLTIATPSP